MDSQREKEGERENKNTSIRYIFDNCSVLYLCFSRGFYCFLIVCVLCVGVLCECVVCGCVVCVYGCMCATVKHKYLQAALHSQVTLENKGGTSAPEASHGAYA